MNSTYARRLVYLCVFFFKQKTAYEMRISDWSSDVCSSDLDGLHRDGKVVGHPAMRRQPGAVRQRALRNRTGNLRRQREIDGTAELVRIRSEERRVGKEWVSTCRYRWSADH